ncbi:MAG: hypothetical protein U9N42_03890 [Campylobacterota bacterium]|nr:hypothetical protein [Campylobacterota bacterium]
MRIILLFIALMMMRELVPYLRPNITGSELLAKEIINGSYKPAIVMTIFNPLTGESRYSESKRKVCVSGCDEDGFDRRINKAQNRVDDIDDSMRLYDREAMLQDAVLPNRVEPKNQDPIIVSKTPPINTFEYLGGFPYNTELRPFGYVYSDKEYIVMYKPTNNYEDTELYFGDENGFILGFTINEQYDKLHFSYHDKVSYLVVNSLASKNVIDVYKFTQSGTQKICTINGYETFEVVYDTVLMDFNNRVYLVVGTNRHQILIDVNSGEILDDYVDGINDSRRFYRVLHRNRYYSNVNSGYFSVKKGKLEFTDTAESNGYVLRTDAVTRYDYINSVNDAHERINLRNGIYVKPYTRVNLAKHIDVLNNYDTDIAISKIDDRDARFYYLYYAPDYKENINSGIKIYEIKKSIRFNNYLYIFHVNRENDAYEELIKIKIRK